MAARASKKGFENIKTDKANKVDEGRVYSTIETGTTTKGQTTASPEEAHERAEALRTSGRKGAKAKRINLAFTDTNYDYIRVVSRIYGEDMTHFVNRCIDEYRTAHAAIYEKAKELQESL